MFWLSMSNRTTKFLNTGQQRLSLQVYVLVRVCKEYPAYRISIKLEQRLRNTLLWRYIMQVVYLIIWSSRCNQLATCDDIPFKTSSGSCEPKDPSQVIPHDDKTWTQFLISQFMQPIVLTPFPIVFWDCYICLF